MSSQRFDQVRTAYTALNDGDPDPLTALFTPDTVWRGLERGLLWWRRAPS